MPPPIDWQRAVASLHAERGRAVTAAGIIKKHGSPAQVSAAELVYGEGKAEADAVIAALRVALDTGTEDAAPADLDTRVRSVSAARMRLAETAHALVGGEEGARSVWVDLLADALPHLAGGWGALGGRAERCGTAAQDRRSAAGGGHLARLR